MIEKKIYKKFIIEEVGEGIKFYYNLFFNDSCRAVYYIRKAQYYSNRNFILKFLSKIYQKKLIARYGIFINPKNLQIGLGLKLPHPNGIIIGENVRIADRCTIYQQVTIGSQHIGDVNKGWQPCIGKNVVIFSGAKIIGNIKIEDGCIIGANAVVTKNTDKNYTYVGIPAKKIKENK